jgi:hypothetical protein
MFVQGNNKPMAMDKLDLITLHFVSMLFVGLFTHVGG